ncbi:MAG: PAS domain S-box protein [Candidatus Omnitrophota bacterium]
MDYIYFIYGLGFLVLASISFILQRKNSPQISWFWLGMFGIVHGAAEWFVLASFYTSNVQTLELISRILSIASFAILVKFGFENTAPLSGRRGNILIGILLLCVVFAGQMLAGSLGADILSRYFLGFPGGVFAAIVIFIKAKEQKKYGWHWLSLAGLFFGLYAFTQIMVPRADFFPASSLNSQIFMETLGFPVQLARAALTFLIAMFAWAFWWISTEIEHQRNHKVSFRYLVFLSLFVLTIIVFGWIFTALIGQQGKNSMREEMLNRAKIAAAALNPSEIAVLEGNDQDINKAEFQHIRTRLMAMRFASGEFRFIYLMGYRNGEVFFLADSEPSQSEDYSPPGQVYTEATPEMIQSFSTGRSFVEGPWTDRWGTWVSAFAPIRSSANDQVVALLGIDLDSGDWESIIFKSRLIGVLFTLILCLVVIGFSIFSIFMRESSIKIAASEDRFRTIFEKAPEGVFIFNADDQRILEANPFVSDALGHHRSELLNMTFDQLFPGLKLGKDYKSDFGEDGPGLIFTEECQFQKKDFSLVDFELTGIGLKFHDKNSILVFMRDVSQRKHVEEILKRNEEYYRSLIENALDIITIVDEAGIIRYISASAFDALGYYPEDLIGKNAFDFIYYDDIPKMQLHLIQILKDPQALRLDTFRFRHRDGSWRILESKGQNRLTDPDVKGIVLNSRDVTARRKTEDRIDKLNNCLVELGTNSDENINKLVALCGELLGASCALYNSLQEGLLCSVGRWQTPEDFNPKDKPEGHICFDVIKKSSEEVIVIQDLPNTPYAQSDPNVKKYGLKTYIGKAIKCSDVYTGSLCLVYQKDFVPADEDKKLFGIIASAISLEEERRFSRKKIQEQVFFLQRLIDAFPNPVFYKDTNFRYTGFNQAFQDFLGLPKEQVIGKTVRDVVAPADAEKHNQKDTDLLNSKSDTIQIYEMDMKSSDGNAHRVVVYKALFFSADGSLGGIVGTIVDITERKRIEEKISEIQRQQEALLNNIPDIAWLKDKESRIVNANEAFCKSCGLNPKDVIGKNDFELWPKDLAEKYRADDIEVMNSRVRKVMEEPIEHKSGKREWIETIKTPVFSPQGEILGSVGIGRDITQRKKAEEEIRKLLRAIEQSPSSVVITNTSGNIEYVNPKFSEATGYSFSEAIGKNPRILKSGETSSDEYKGLWEAITSGQEWRGIFHNKRKNGELFWESASISPVRNIDGVITHFVAIKEDITEQKKMSDELLLRNQELIKREEELSKALGDLKMAHGELKNTQNQLLQAEKLAAIGQLAAGVAHEINNPLGFISSNLETLEQYIDSYLEILRATEELKMSVGEKDLKEANAIRQKITQLEKDKNFDFIVSDVANLIKESKGGIDRIKRIVKDLRTFARDDKDVMSLSSVEEVLDGVINIVWNEIKYKADLHKEYGQAPAVQCNAQRLGQVFMNILVNAVQAIREKGTINIKTFFDQKNVYVEIEDSGSGIAKEDILKIFDPFFTTKPVGKGTGLGLSISYDIIKKHGGEIKVESEPGKGSKFTVVLPRGASKA